MTENSSCLELENVFSLQKTSDAQISPGGSQVAFTSSQHCKIDDNANPISHIWMVSVNGGDERPLVHENVSNRMPRWSPVLKESSEGALPSDLAFMSDRSDPSKGIHLPYLLRAGGGEAVPIHGIKGNVEHMQWLGDGRHLVLLVTQPETEEEKRRAEERDDRIVFEEEGKYQQLWLADIKADTATIISPQDLHIWEFDICEENENIVALVSDEPHLHSWYSAHLAVWGIPEHPHEDEPVEPRRLYLPPCDVQIACPTWSPGGDRVAFITCTCSDPGLVTGDIWVKSADADNKPECLTPNASFSANWLQWTDNDKLFFSSYCEGDLMLGRIKLDGDEVTCEKVHQSGRATPGRARFSLDSCTQRLAMAVESPNSPPEVWLGHLDQTDCDVEDPSNEQLQLHCLTSVNSCAESFKLGQTEVVTWPAPDGLEIQGLLVKPPGYTQGERYPLVVRVHGGPTSLHKQGFSASPGSWAQLLAARGFCVLLPNPRGSAGWGTSFSSANVGDVGEGDFCDIMAGVDHCIELGIADPEQIGIGGGSFGGYMTAWAISQTDRFRAAIMSAGIVNVLSFYGTSDRPNYASQFHDADPYASDMFTRYSPITYADQIHTPTLILHGEKDQCCDVGQAKELFRALREHGNTPVRLVIYPREGHGIREKKHLQDYLKRILNWYSKHLKDSNN